MAVAGLRGVECDTGDTDDSLTMELVRITRGRGCRVITTTGGLLMALGVNTLRHSVHASISELSGGIRVIWRMLIRVTYWHYQYWYQSHVQSVPWGHVAMCQPQWAPCQSLWAESEREGVSVIRRHHQGPGDSLHHHHPGDQRPAGARPVSPPRDQNCHFTFLKSLSHICQRSWPLIGPLGQAGLWLVAGVTWQGS